MAAISNLEKSSLRIIPEINVIFSLKPFELLRILNPLYIHITERITKTILNKTKIIKLSESKGVNVTGSEDSSSISLICSTFSFTENKKASGGTMIKGNRTMAMMPIKSTNRKRKPFRMAAAIPHTIIKIIQLIKFSKSGIRGLTFFAE